MSSSTAQLTDFSLDILGRYLCNGFDEAMRSTDKNAGRPDGGPQSDARPFNAIIIGGGSFGGILAQHLLYADDTNSYRILILEAAGTRFPSTFRTFHCSVSRWKCGDCRGSAIPRTDILVLPIRLEAARCSSAAGHLGCSTRKWPRVGGHRMWSRR